MVWWVTLLWYVGATIVTELLRPKPNLENARPAGLGDFNFPTSQEGRVIPVLWGTSLQKGPNLIWFGDLGSEAITEKVKTGLFSSDTITKGFRYSIGMQLAICRGQLTNNGHDGIRRIFVDDKQVRPGTGSPGTFPPVDSGTITINKPDFNGEESNLAGTLRVHDGGPSQSVSNYLTGVVVGGATDLPAYNGTVYLVWERGEIGTSPNLAPWSFEVTRIPNGLGFSGSPNEAYLYEDDVPHANPMNVLYEILTDADWGAGVSASLIDTASFIAAGEQLYSEGNGFSMLMDNPKQIGKIIEEIERQCDGALLLDESTGLYEFLLARENTDSPDTTPVVDETNCTSVKLSRTSWENTMNEVRVPYHDPSKDYAESFAIAQDGANNKIQQANVGTTTRFPGCKQGSLAAQLSWRELRFLAYPLSKCTLKVDRTMFEIKPTESLNLTWGPLGITNVRYRVSKVNLGDMDNGQISLECVEDIFQTDIASFADPITSRWQPVSVDPVQPLGISLFEMPLPFMTIGSGTQVGVCVVRGGPSQASYDVWTTGNQSIAPGSPFGATGDGNFSFETTVHEFTPSGLLQGALPATTPFREEDSPPAPGIRIDNTTDIGRVVTAGSALLSELTSDNIVNIILIDKEFIFYESITQNSPEGNYTLHGIHRGMMNSVVSDHADNARVFFVTLGIGRIPAGNDTIPGTVDAMVVRILSSTPLTTMDLANGAEASIDLEHRSVAEAPPADPIMNLERIVDIGSLTSPEGVTCGDLTFSWRGRDLQAQRVDGITVDQESGDIAPRGGTTYRVEVFRTDISPSVSIFEKTGIVHVGAEISPSGGSYRLGAGRYVIAGEDRSPQVGSPLAPVKTYRAEIYSRRLGVDSEKWITPEFTIAGYGLDYGENYGGLCEPGINLAQRDPPVSQDEVGGDDDTINQWQILVEGDHGGAGDDWFAEAFYSTGEPGGFDSVDLSFDGGTLTTRNAVTQHLSEGLTDFLPDDIFLVESNISQGLIRVSMTGDSGSFSFDAQPLDANGFPRRVAALLIQEEAAIQTTRRRGFYTHDFWDRERVGDQIVHSLSAAESEQYEKSGWYTSDILVRPMNYAARLEFERRLGDTGFAGGLWGDTYHTSVAQPAGLQPPPGTTNYDYISPFLLTELEGRDLPQAVRSIGRMMINDADVEPGKELERRPNASIEYLDNFQGQPDRTPVSASALLGDPAKLTPDGRFGSSAQFVQSWNENRAPLEWIPTGRPRVYWLLGQILEGLQYVLKKDGVIVVSETFGPSPSDNDARQTFIDDFITAADAVSGLTVRRKPHPDQTDSSIMEISGGDTINYDLEYLVREPDGMIISFAEL
jgi:hypothetical protein